MIPSLNNTDVITLLMSVLLSQKLSMTLEVCCQFSNEVPPYACLTHSTSPMVR
ncbi:hypothetical protein SynBIOSE41_01733 [Synechococcus sp. BIOS-E4-1]|nr:hypothetical protein SynBIOSE41_01733 [Synechococcus sp. BIOS-E4-1]